MNEAAPKEKPQPISAPGVPDGPALPLFWFKADNFGDALSPLVVSHVAGRPVRHVGAARAPLFALGSLMGWVANRFKTAEPGAPKPIIWGTGCIEPEDQTFLANVDIRALRGPISGALLWKQDRVSYGDPGLFVSEFVDAEPGSRGKIGIVAHHKRVDEPELAAVLADHPEVELIDVRTADAIAVVKKIASCRYVLSSSLHGLVVADAFGIPNHWLDPRGNHRFPELKFYDYANSVGRDLGQPLAWAEVPAFLRGPLPTALPYADGIIASKAALRGAFPPELRRAA